jgi:hypothetical protein
MAITGGQGLIDRNRGHHVPFGQGSEQDGRASGRRHACSRPRLSRWPALRTVEIRPSAAGPRPEITPGKAVTTVTGRPLPVQKVTTVTAMTAFPRLDPAGTFGGAINFANRVLVSLVAVVYFHHDAWFA